MPDLACSGKIKDVIGGGSSIAACDNVAAGESVARRPVELAAPLIFAVI